MSNETFITLRRADVQSLAGVAIRILNPALVGQPLELARERLIHAIIAAGVRCSVCNDRPMTHEAERGGDVRFPICDKCDMKPLFVPTPLPASAGTEEVSLARWYHERFVRQCAGVERCPCDAHPSTLCVTCKGACGCHFAAALIPDAPKPADPIG